MAIFAQNFSMRFFCLSLLLLTTYTAHSQILNVERSRKAEQDTTRRWLGRIDLNFLLHNRSATAENPIKYTSLSSSADIAYFGQTNRYMLLNQITYGAVTGNAFIRTGYSHFRANWWWRNNLSGESFGQIQYDLGRGLQSRRLAGSGGRLILSDTEKARVAIGVGLMYEEERWRIPNSEPEAITKKNLVKATNYASVAWTISPQANFNGIVYYQTGPDREDDLWRNRLSLDTNISFGLTEKLVFLTTFTAAYDAQPIVPIPNWTYSLLNGFRFNF